MSKGMYYQLNEKPEATTLILKVIYPKKRRPIYCIHCGSLLQYTYKVVVMIIQGAASDTEVLDEIICHKCKGLFEIC